ncbi:hypothetical protein H1220_04745 [Carnobacteriaceae bacterium zg-84]|uniref:PepSY domain-containing protein n=1 Tax=Granulicatella sp. zg-84 TaxID=2678503 RepID=UPI0013BF45DE|nr:PepSY domain-containing protein [Granulicatella sp. zg-84]NEW66619.1 hypothetical protein [Granulicatella sp. zg-84]QMI85057.1 hypothetical protein H1220_04745 [Carnobacteriaceae bacterium zg-84]
MQKNFSKTVIFLSTFILCACSNQSQQNISHSVTTTTTQQTTAQQTIMKQSSTQTSSTVDYDVNEIVALVKKDFPDFDIESISLTLNVPTPLFEVDLIGNDSEKTIQVNTQTKDKVILKEEMLDSDERNGVERQKEAINTSSLSSITNVLNAVKQTLAVDTVTKISLDQELGITYWEVELYSANQKKEVKVDNATLKVLEIDHD